MSFIVIASGYYLYQINDFYKEINKLKEERGQYILQKTNSALQDLLNQLQRDVLLLSQSHKEQITRLIDDPGDFEIYDSLIDEIKTVHPGVFAVTVADNEGKEIVVDYEGYIQQTCIDDISAFSSSRDHPDIYIHPNPYMYHFDMMKEIVVNDKNYIFFVSFDSQLISKILEANATPGYKLLLINKDINNLIEATVEGSRNVLDGNNFINDSDRENLIAETYIPETKWNLLLLNTDSNQIGILKVSPQSHVWPIIIFNLICIVSVILLQVMKRRIQSQNVLIYEKSKALTLHQEHLMAMFSSILDGIVTIDVNGIITEVNPAAEDMFGYSSNEMLGKNGKILLPENNHDAFDDFIDTYSETNKSSVVDTTKKSHGLRKNGDTFPIEISVNVADYHGVVEFVAVVRDVTHRTKIEKIKNEFISTVSHEMRTPLTSIRGSLGLIAGGAMGEVAPDINNLIKISINNTERLIRMINDILDIDRIESGSMTFNFDNISLNSVTIDSINNIQGMAEDKSITVDYRCLCTDSDVLADRDRLTQVIVNLLSNSIKFSHPDDTVLVILDCTEDMCTLSIKDTGIGISEQDQEIIFDKFTQVDSSDTRDIGGSGLGLTIVRSIIDAHHGEIELVSKQSIGSTFIIHLPR